MPPSQDCSMQQCLLAFLKQVTRAYPEGEPHVVMDKYAATNTGSDQAATQQCRSRLQRRPATMRPRPRRRGERAEDLSLVRTRRVEVLGG